jgi:hypothetical protein
MSEPDDKYLDDDKFLAECLATLKQKYDEGNKAAVLVAVYQCALMRKPLPDWLREAFIKAYELAAAFEIRSWDAAFGRPQVQGAELKGAHLGARKEYADLRYPVALRVALRASEEIIEPDLFDKIGSELGVGKTKAADVYYKYGGKELAEAMAPIAPFLRRRLNSEKT